jgi:F-type H+-transporting ATPase subunit epsilon
MRLSVTTPQGSLVETDADEVTAPGVMGEFGVLPGHVPFLSALQPGVFVFRAGQENRIFAVSEGVLEVARKDGGGDKVLVLVSDAVQAEEIDRDAAQKDLTQADSELAHWNKDLGGEYKALLTRRAWAAARIAASTRATAH